MLAYISIYIVAILYFVREMFLSDGDFELFISLEHFAYVLIVIPIGIIGYEFRHFHLLYSDLSERKFTDFICDLISPNGTTNIDRTEKIFLSLTLVSLLTGVITIIIKYI
jgi:hypothetical protein